MGVWGPALFSDDEASDVRDLYGDLLADQTPDADAERQVLAALGAGTGPSDVVWLALAATQHRLGRLSDEVARRALDVIDSGRDLERWAEATPGHRRRRQAALESLRTMLTGPQPGRRRVRPRWRPVTDLEPGDVLALTGPEGGVRLVRAVGVTRTRAGDDVRVELLPDALTAVPTADDLLVLAQGRPGERRPRWTVAPHHAYEATWRSAGFVRAGRVPADLPGPAGTPRGHATWEQLRDEVVAGGGS